MGRRNALIIRAMLVGALALVSGCYTFEESRAERRPRVAVPPDAWRAVPEPGEGLARLHRQTPREVATYAPLDSSVDAATREAVAAARTVVTVNELTPGGLLRVWREEPIAVRGKADDFWTDDRHFASPIVPPNGAFMTESIFHAEAEKIAARAHARLSANAPLKGTRPGFAAVSRDPMVFARRAAPGVDGVLLGEGHEVGFPARVAPDASGTLVYLPSTVPTRYERRLLEDLAERGWAIVFVDSRPRVRAPNHAGIARARELRSIYRERLASTLGRVDFAAMMASHRRTVGDIPSPSGFAVVEGADGGGIAGAADAIARAVDTLLAEHALAAEAALGHFFASHPHLAERPVGVIGFSAGALAAPVVAARLEGSFPRTELALVLVGGGGNIVQLSANSEFTDGGIRFDGPAETRPDPRQMLALSEAYLERSRLDPANAVKALRHIPVLHVYADDDTWVPTAGAELLNEAHGAVDRLVHDGGHTTLFYFLGTQHRRIANWLERALLAGDR